MGQTVYCPAISKTFQGVTKKFYSTLSRKLERTILFQCYFIVSRPEFTENVCKYNANHF